MGGVECPSALEEKLDAVLLAVDNTQTSLESKIDTVSSDLSLLHADHRKLADRVTLVEQDTQAFPLRRIPTHEEHRSANVEGEEQREVAEIHRTHPKEQLIVKIRKKEIT
ncbi:hypothetical protein NDU88_003861 [Pleurodeles waltl]|uniref:Uncharacterized protein n=1 Tax=Pleurodeles waltl TaxID=8319 RepID=A0AAV7RFF4_PLEWA|nr:hypothetical protein NDU88_003860 [Pleurodeles waltl]KAJ1151074.1 hypothetical protein NDU88_003861 [Pleurodeles waltl]